MKNLLLSILYIFSIALSFSASAKELKVGLAELDYPPYYYEIDGQYYGAALEVSQAIAKTLGHELVFLRAPWKRIQFYLRTGGVDMMILYLKTQERAQDVVYVDTPHIYESSNLFVAKNSDVKFNSHLSDLMSYRFGHVRGYSHGIEYNSAKNLFKKEFNNEELLIRVLVKGRVDIAVGNKQVIIRYAEKLGMRDEIRFLESPIDIGANYIAFSKARKDSQDLADEFSTELRNYMKTDRYRDILKKYNFDVHK